MHRPGAPPPGREVLSQCSCQPHPFGSRRPLLSSLGFYTDVSQLGKLTLNTLRIRVVLQCCRHADRIGPIMTMTADPTVRPSVIVANLPPEETYRLALNMRKKHQDSLKVATELAKEMGMIPDATIHEVMNLLLNLGFEYLKTESLRRQGYK